MFQSLELISKKNIWNLFPVQSFLRIDIHFKFVSLHELRYFNIQDEADHDYYLVFLWPPKSKINIAFHIFCLCVAA